jgi:hypothetical protein
MQKQEFPVPRRVSVTWKEYSRTILLAGEDVDGFGSRLRGADKSLKMEHVRGGSAGGSALYRDLSYPSPTTPWDSGIGDLRSSTEALHHPSRAGPPEATQYMSQYLMRARGSETGSMFHEGVWPPPGEGASLVDPILRSSRQVDLTGSWIALWDLVGKAFPLMGSTVEVEGVTRGTSVEIVRLLYYLPVLRPLLHPLR